MPKDSVGGAAPAAAILLAFAERQVIEDAGGKTVIEVQLRQAPIQLRSARQRVIERTWVRAETVGQAGIEIARIGIADQSVETMPRALGLGFDLQGIITGGTDAVIDVNTLKGPSSRLVPRVREVSKAAAQRVARREICAAGAGAGIIEVFVELAD